MNELRLYEMPTGVASEDATAQTVLEVQHKSDDAYQIRMNKNRSDGKRFYTIITLDEEFLEIFAEKIQKAIAARAQAA